MLAGALVACGGSGATDAPPAGISPLASVYLTAALDTMQHHSINRYKVNWPAVRAAAFAQAGAAQTPSGTYDAIAQALQTLGDNHSHFYTPGTYDRAPAPSPVASLAASADPAPTPTNRPTGHMLDARTAYVFVPFFVGRNGTARADSTLAIVRALDAAGGASGPCGWVVDLRLNQGGNMYPMIAGLGPLLGDARLGVFVDADSVRQYWYHRAGAAGLTIGGTDYPQVTVSAPYALRRAAPAVAVLYGPLTASSGESTAISFRGAPNARSFGTPTYGVSTANDGYPMSDGALLNLTVAVDGDRTGRLYGGPLVPDQGTPDVTPDPFSAVADAGVQAAMQWLAAQPACAADAASLRGARSADR